MLKSFSFIFIAILFFSCKNDSIKKESNSIVIIFKPNPNAETINFGNAEICVSYPLKYFNSEKFTEELLYPNYTEKSDTIEIIGLKKLAIYYAYKYQPYNLYLKQGDTLVVDSKIDGLCCKTINRETKPYDIDFNYFFYKSIPDSINFNLQYYFDKTILQNKKITDKGVSDYLSLLIYYNKKRDSVLDSLNSKYQISTEYYRFYKKINLIWYNKIIKESQQFFKSTDSSNRFLEHSDSLIEFADYRTIVRQEIESQVKVLSSSNSRYIDSREAFEKVTNGQIFSGKTKNYLLTRYLVLIYNYFPNEFLNYLDKYKIEINDSSLCNKADNLKIRYLKILESAKDTSTTLIDLNNDKTSLHKLIEKYKGKVIYIDFWASWCAPCRKSMPFAKHLRDDYFGKNVVFIYLACNDQEKTWRLAIPKLRLDYNAQNYIIANPNSSIFLNTLKVNTIPRYLLFDKNGRLVNQNAPGPEGNEIRKFIDKYVSE